MCIPSFTFWVMMATTHYGKTALQYIESNGVTILYTSQEAISNASIYYLDF